MKKLLMIVVLLAGCGPVPRLGMTDEEMGAAVARCAALGLIARGYAYTVEGRPARVRCEIPRY